MPRSLSHITGAVAAAVAMLAVPTCTAQTAESAASPKDLAQCLIDHGVPADAATPPVPSGVDDATWNDAFAACAELAPGTLPGHPGRPPT